jgi:Dyp-type peroxidase family
MPVDLNNPLAWKTATGDASAMLDQLQPNIVKGHVREHLRILLVQFADKAEGRAFLKAVGGKVKSAKKHLQEVEQFTANGTPGTAYVGVGLTFEGYKQLGIPTAKIPGNGSEPGRPFEVGMRSAASRQTLADPPLATWEEPYRHTIHAVVLIGDADKAKMLAKRAVIRQLFTPKVKLLGEETGLGQHNALGQGIEHFGYIDGRSQPLFLKEEIAPEPKTQWDPAFPLGQLIVADSAAPNPVQQFGSFFVLRKLEQNVRAFHKAEADIATELGLTGADRARAGAMVVGRFRDGTALTAHSKALGENPIPNDFDYDKDPGGARCPFHGHIRKTNPRGSTSFGGPPDSERSHLMARRGQTYGKRTDNPNATSLPLSERPTGGVGLLFMAFNADLSNQFEFTQSSWADNTGFPFGDHIGGNAPVGLDQVIGQGARPKPAWPLKWDKPQAKVAKPAPQAVTMKGGEYFFMPSIAFLKAL